MITVMVERHFQSQKTEETDDLLAELSRRNAQQSSYITGEVLQ